MIERPQTPFGSAPLGRVCIAIMGGELSNLEVPGHDLPFESLLPVYRIGCIDQTDAHGEC
jgi:hypothetical protein